MRCPFCKADLSDLFARLGKKGGSASTPAKVAAARENAKKGGWPKGRKRKVIAASRTSSMDESKQIPSPDKK